MLNTTYIDSGRDQRWFLTGLGILCALGAGWLIGTWGTMGALLMVGVPMVLVTLVSVLADPRVGLFLYLNLSFIIGWTRFLDSEIPVGTGLDGLAMLTLLSTFLHGKYMSWKQLRQPIFWLLVVWLSFTILEYFNPEHPYPAAWFYGARSMSLSWFFIGIITLVTPLTKKDIRLIINTWLFWSLVAALWGFKQQYIGLEPAELRWLASGAEKQHIIWGQLRSFSYYSDAGQFGSEMAGVTLVCLLLFAEVKGWGYRLIFAVLALTFFWGFAVSGTRGALFVIVGGILAYLVLKRNFKYILRAIVVAIPLLVILLFTHIGDGVYQIWRLRTALHPTEDPSFVVRLENQQKLQQFMKDRPFGVGIGTSSGNGQRFSPDHFAAQIPTDSWYVQVWIETGIVGLTLYLLMLLTILLIGTYKVWQLKDPWTKKVMLILLAEFAGICVVSYTNPILGQFPTSTVLFITSILFTTCERWDTSTESAGISTPSKLTHHHENRN